MERSSVHENYTCLGYMNLCSIRVILPSFLTKFAKASMNRQLLIQELKKISTDLAEKVESALQKSEDKAEHYKSRLELLEKAVSSDYDSILITELNLEFPGPKIVYANKGFTKLTGYTLEEVLGKTPRILQGPKTDRATLDRLKKNLIEGQSFFGQTVNYRKDGSEFINQWDIHPLENENGEITHWVSYQHDVTTRKMAEINLSYNPDTDFDQMDELNKSILIDFDMQGNVLYANKSFREMTGHMLDHLKQIKIWDLVSINGLSQTDFEKGFAIRFSSNDYIKSNFKTLKGDELNVLIKAEWKNIDGQETLRMTIKNLSLQNRVLDAISKIKELSKEMNHDLEQLNPTKVVFMKSGNSWKIKEAHNTLKDYFPKLANGVTLNDCNLPMVDQLDFWSQRLHETQSICEYTRIGNTPFTIYLKALGDTEIEYQLSLNHQEVEQ